MPPEKEKLGNYLIIDKIASGGMAHVYKAKTVDPKGIERLVVIKRILPHISSNPEYVEMLIDEAKIAVQFNHGNIAQVYDLGKYKEDYFIVMEYVDGKTLSQILKEFQSRNERLPIDFIVYALIQVCQGLDYMHRKIDTSGNSLGVVHRDISPQNIIVSYSSDVKIIDFGVAKASEKVSHTESGVLKGKFAYMSPEQAEGEDLDSRSDIFSAGILLWEMLTNQRLFKRKSNPKTIQAVKKDKVTPPSKIRTDIPKNLDKIIKKALHKNKAKRYQQASEMAFDLERFLVEYYPNFRPTHVSKLLYRYFGPEPDEEGMEPELPELAVSRKSKKKRSQSQIAQEEEKTEVDFVNRLRLLKPLLIFVTVFTIFASGATYVYLEYFKTYISKLSLTVEPYQAEVFLNDKKIKSPDGNYLIEIEADKKFLLRAEEKGYHPYKVYLHLARHEDKNLQIKLEKKIPPYASVYLETHPPGATIYIDDAKWQQLSPTKIPRLKKNRDYRISLFLEGYRFKEEIIRLSDEDTVKNITIPLEIDFASLHIFTLPQGAMVVMDDQILGRTPYKLNNIQADQEIEFDLVLEGYQTVSKTLQLKAGEQKDLKIDLKAED